MPDARREKTHTHTKRALGHEQQQELEQQAEWEQELDMETEVVVEGGSWPAKVQTN